eukprot:365362-Chlamydomonas_euryale.AAC.5
MPHLSSEPPLPIQPSHALPVLPLPQGASYATFVFLLPQNQAIPRLSSRSPNNQGMPCLLAHPKIKLSQACPLAPQPNHATPVLPLLQRLGSILPEQVIHIRSTKLTATTSGAADTYVANTDLQTFEVWRSSRAAECDFSSHDAIHMYYTSGTTGRPKGVLLSHRTVMMHAIGTIRGEGACCARA